LIPFRVEFRPGASLFEQVVYAAKRAIIAGQLQPGDPFPSVRLLSKELKINPNTAHKIVTHLLTTGLLESQPGIGTVVASLPEPTKVERAQLLEDEIEHLVVEAKRLGIELDVVSAAMRSHWVRLGGDSMESGRGGRRKR